MRVERRGEISIWTLDRPATRNALDATTFAALHRAIDDAESDEALRAVVLTGAGNVFASGGDLRELRTGTSARDAEQVCDVGRRACGRIIALPVPVLAALPGPAIGAGAELAMACDLRIADPRASICFKHVRVGATTACGILPRLFSAVGRPAASRLLLTAQAIDAAEALRIGLVDAVSEPGDCVEYALRWAGDIARGAPLAVAAMKSLLQAPVGDLAALERERFLATWTTADHAEAVEAFFASRSPRWTGK
jgi:enoyl-CoA hydratase